jgi:hypothetical protein
MSGDNDGGFPWFWVIMICIFFGGTIKGCWHSCRVSLTTDPVEKKILQIDYDESLSDEEKKELKTKLYMQGRQEGGEEAPKPPKAGGGIRITVPNAAIRVEKGIIVGASETNAVEQVPVAAPDNLPRKPPQEAESQPDGWSDETCW